MMLLISIEDSEPFSQRQSLIASAEAGDPRSQSKLGDLRRVGDELTERDYSAAIGWYPQGDSSATNNLGTMRLNGWVPDRTRWCHSLNRKAADRLVMAGTNDQLRLLGSLKR